MFIKLQTVLTKQRLKALLVLHSQLLQLFKYRLARDMLVIICTEQRMIRPTPFTTLAKKDILIFILPLLQSEIYKYHLKVSSMPIHNG